MHNQLITVHTRHPEYPVLNTSRHSQVDLFTHAVGDRYKSSGSPSCRGARWQDVTFSYRFLSLHADSVWRVTCMCLHVTYKAFRVSAQSQGALVKCLFLERYTWPLVTCASQLVSLVTASRSCSCCLTALHVSSKPGGILQKRNMLIKLDVIIITLA